MTNPSAISDVKFHNNKNSFYVNIYIFPNIEGVWSLQFLVLLILSSNEKSLSLYCLSSTKNCEDHTHSLQSEVLIREIRVLTSHIIII